MTQEGRSLIIESFGNVFNINLSGGRIMHVPFSTSAKEIKAAIAYFDHKFERETASLENTDNVYIEITFEETLA